MIETTLAGRYYIEEQIGIGGMGIVYRARDLRLRREVAIKVIAPHLMQQEAARARFLREAHALAGLMHPNIVTIFDMAEDQDTHTVFLVMELLSGHSLRHFIHDGGCPPTLECPSFSQVALPLCRALEAAHTKGVLHRDIKPENIFVCEDGILKLMDFGLARLLGDVSKNQSSTVAGTLAYMAPEQLRGEAMDVRTDLYALGVVFFEYLSGALPFTGNNPGTVLLKHLTEAPPHLCDRLPDFPQPMDDVVTRMLAKEPDARFATAGEVRSTLEQVDPDGKLLLNAVDTALISIQNSFDNSGARNLPDAGRAHVTQMSPVTASLEEITARLAPRQSSLQQSSLLNEDMQQEAVQHNSRPQTPAVPIPSLSLSNFGSFLRSPARLATTGVFVALSAIAALFAGQSYWSRVSRHAVTNSLSQPLAQIKPAPAAATPATEIASKASNETSNETSNEANSQAVKTGDNNSGKKIDSPPDQQNKSDKTTQIDQTDKKEAPPVLTDKHLQELEALRKEQKQELELIKSLKHQIETEMVTPPSQSSSLVTAQPPGSTLKPDITPDKPVSTTAIPTAPATRNVMTMPVRSRLPRFHPPVIVTNTASSAATSQFEERRPQPALKVRAWHAIAPADTKAIHIGLQNSADCNAYFYIIESDTHRAVRAYPGPERFLVPHAPLPNEVRLPYATDTSPENQKAVLVIASPREINSLPVTFTLPPPPQGSPPSGANQQQMRAYFQQALHHYDDQIGQQLEQNHARIAGQPLHPHDIIIHIVGLNRF